MLPVDPVSVSSARQYASKVLARLGWERMTDVAQLVISELVTNGLRAALLLDGRAEGDDQPEKPIAEQYADCDRYLCVGLYLAPHGVVVEVWDPSPEPPKLREPGPDDISGRGLHLVNEIAACWGCRWIKPEGKVVWARLPDESVFPPPDGPGSARRER
ncbi:hypothetical protein HNP84_009342 [Thermocatellispora tengchongensis]|uniref:Histidine kinase/HSP90-like ATPase domain-containing protein n=1 Tax=Thermocatellispora tengchongensis TaxID=1073253 RepID=A0A840PKV8_9ACTN|nr:ATP-binding protein [Thermocatellispora tengchongensis]MBB5139579.1 hypothetical protein [Thermocatellispora tengchongensis]